MALAIQDKKEIVADVAAIAGAAQSVVAAEYRGLTVEEMTLLRQSARAQNVRVRVVRNTLARRAFLGTPFESMNDALVGPIMLAFSTEELAGAARLFRDFAKKHEALKVQALSIGEGCLSAAQLETVASLPTRDEALSQLLRVMKAPIEKFVRTLAEPNAKFVRTVAAVAEQKK